MIPIDPIHASRSQPQPRAKFKARCPLCQRFVYINSDTMKLVRHSPPGKASRHKCQGSGLEVRRAQTGDNK